MPVKLSEKLVDKAIADAKAGKTYDLTDSGAAGLILRAAPRGAVWIIRFMWGGSFKRLRIGLVSAISLTIARAIAGDARKLLIEGRCCPTETWMTEQLVINRIVKKPEPAPLLPLVMPKMWTFSQAREHYLEEVKRTLRPSTWIDRRGMLGITELKHLADRPVGLITRADMATIVAAIFKSGRERNAGHLAEVIRPMWSWLAEEVQRRRSGVLEDEMKGLKAPKATNRETHDEDDEAGTYLPLPHELGRVLAMIRAGAVNQTMADAALLLLFTSQRRRTVVTARRSHFIEEDGVLVWQIPPRYRKTGRGKKRSHDLPLSGEAAAMVRRRLAKATEDVAESAWLFPGLRPRRTGDAVGHLHADSLTHTFADLPGITMSPHDTRRGFTTYLEDILGLDQADLKPVLDHSEGKASNDVTDAAYSQARRLKRKSMILEAWAGFLVEQAAQIELGNLAAIKKAITAARVERARLSAKRKRVYAPRPGRKKAA